MLEKQLEEIGLQEKEAKVYIAALELGQATASEIAKKAGINRATAYFVIENLMKIGLLSSSSESKKQMFTPEDPSQLTEIIDQQKQELERKKEKLPDLVKELKSINAASVKKPIVKYYLGKEGIMRMAKSSFDYTEGETMWLAFSLDALNDFLSKAERETLKDQRVIKKTFLKSIYNSNSDKSIAVVKGEAIRVDKNKYPLPADIAVYKDSIRLTSYKDQIGIIITNKDIATTLQTLFRLAENTSSIEKNKPLT